MNRFNLIPGKSTSIDVGINRYRDASLILRAKGEAVPRVTDFDRGWGINLSGRFAIWAAAEDLRDYANFQGTGVIAGARAELLATKLESVIDDWTPLEPDSIGI